MKELTQEERRIGNKARRNRDIYHFVMEKLSVKVNGKELYQYGAVLAMAEVKFYLAPDTIADIVRDYEPPPPDPDQAVIQFPDTPPTSKPDNTLAT